MSSQKSSIEKIDKSDIFANTRRTNSQIEIIQVNRLVGPHSKMTDYAPGNQSIKSNMK